MCGRYTLTRNEKIVEQLEAALDLSAAHDPWWKPRFNVAPTQPAPVVTLHDGARTVELMRWGLVPFWAGHGGKKAPLMINARVESLGAKQVFRDALQSKRCLVPADGFFEWVAPAHDARAAGKKPPPRPFYFHPRSHGIFAFAGLWARSHDDRGDEQRSFTIITARANDLVRPIHDRMPIVLAPSDYAAWLDPAQGGDRARALLGVPAGPADWIREPVSTWVNKADHDDPGCIAPDAPDAPDAPGGPPGQGRLFD
jgi:putative SOS response-associated peptidase YedK